MDAQLLASTSLAPVRSHLPDAANVPWNRAEMTDVHSDYLDALSQSSSSRGRRVRGQLQNESWHFDANGDLEVRVSKPIDVWL